MQCIQCDLISVLLHCDCHNMNTDLVVVESLPTNEGYIYVAMSEGMETLCTSFHKCHYWNNS